MKLKFYLLFTLLLLWFPAVSQELKTDSLATALSKAKNDIEKATLLNAMATAYLSEDPKKTIDYANQALQLSEKINYRIAQGNAHLNLGNANIVTGNYPVALTHFSMAQEVFEALLLGGKDKKTIKNGLARAYGSMGIVFSEQSNYAKALQYHLKAVKLYEGLNEAGTAARIYNNIGIVYQAQGETFKALEYFVKAQQIQEQTNDPSVGITTTNIGNIYLKQKNYNDALAYYMKAQQLLEKNADARGVGELYNNLGLYYQATANEELALQHWEKAIVAFESIADKFGIADTYAHLGKFYFEQGDYSMALGYTNKTLALAKELKVLEQIMIAEKLLSDIYRKQNNPAEALLHFERFSNAKDSLSSHENIRNAVQAEMNFEFEKREALQKEAHEKKELLFAEASKRHQMQVIFGGLLLVLLFGIGFLIYSRSQLKKNLTLQKELAEYEQKALHLQMNPHFVFNCLGSISSFIVQNGTDSAIKYLSKFSKLMRLTLEYSKEALIPIDKEIESLQNYLELEQLRFNQKFDFSITKCPEIEDDMALPPLLLQPFVENAIIHGLIPKKDVGKIAIDFAVEGDNMICTIIDNGIGFDKSKELKEFSVSIHKSMALDITKKRLEMMESVTRKMSQVEINEIKDATGETTGTKVVLRLPIQYVK